MMPAELSGGMRKRIALARTMHSSNQKFFFKKDEPTSRFGTRLPLEKSVELIEPGFKRKNTIPLPSSYRTTWIVSDMTANRIIIADMRAKNYAEGTFEKHKVKNRDLKVMGILRRTIELLDKKNYPMPRARSSTIVIAGFTVSRLFAFLYDREESKTSWGTSMHIYVRNAGGERGYFLETMCCTKGMNCRHGSDIMYWMKLRYRWAY